MLFLYKKFGRALAALIVTILCTAMVSSRTNPAGDATDGGTTITNRAEATYQGADGTTYNTSSQTITLTVLPVATLTVGPKETTPSASVGPQQRVTRLFRICNTGNVPSSYTITDASVSSPAKLIILSFDNDASGTVSFDDLLITIGETSSISVAPGSCLGVLAVVDTLDIPADSLLQINLRAGTNAAGAANGRAEDNGTIINSVGRGPQFSNPTSAALPPLKQVNDTNQTVVTRGTPFTYSLAFRNSGDVTARNVMISDEIPTGIDYVPGSLRLESNGGKQLTDAQDADEGFVRGQHLELRLAEVSPNEIVRFNFKAQLGSDASGAIGLVNVAQVFADNTATTKTNSVVVLADPFGTVFSGRGGAASPVPGAAVSLFSDRALTNLLPLPTGGGFIPNLENVNPWTTDYLGHFGFLVSESHIGTASSPTKYYLQVTAPGFTPRLLELTLSAGDSGLFTLTQRALDGQALAVGGG
ncbi:MAG TPA: isopeptide-forming domain-containing fimbrial protein, partial [Pyrinomonadaceae bacterium]|nr:isopeptide-forming domain-containing fimbrial protein [Pyrinomonadaceae bacterium]